MENLYLVGEVQKVCDGSRDRGCEVMVDEIDTKGVVIAVRARISREIKNSADKLRASVISSGENLRVVNGTTTLTILRPNSDGTLHFTYSLTIPINGRMETLHYGFEYTQNEGNLSLNTIVLIDGEGVLVSKTEAPFFGEEASLTVENRDASLIGIHLNNFATDTNYVVGGVMIAASEEELLNGEAEILRTLTPPIPLTLTEEEISELIMSMVKDALRLTGYQTTILDELN